MKSIVVYTLPTELYELALAGLEYKREEVLDKIQEVEARLRGEIYTLPSGQPCCPRHGSDYNEAHCEICCQLTGVNYDPARDGMARPGTPPGKTRNFRKPEPEPETIPVQDEAPPIPKVKLVRKVKRHKKVKRVLSEQGKRNIQLALKKRWKAFYAARKKAKAK